eukprot:gene38671-46833_t
MWFDFSNRQEGAHPCISKSCCNFPYQRFQLHNIVAKLLYRSKRARHDILTAVAFSTSRVLNPTSEEDKLKRVLRFLENEREVGL